MKKFFLICVSLLTVIAGYAQSYMNEWVEFGKPYYKFKIGATGVYRISQADLASIGLGNTDAAHFQLWNKGKEIPIYTSVQSGILPAQGFIEFWGETNDGEWESRLYIKPEYQINPLVSLFTDTSVYFLTVNKKTINKRLKPTINSDGSSIAAEPFFMHKIAAGYRGQYSNGFAVNVGSEVFSASYDSGEGYVSGNIGSGQINAINLSNLMVASGAGGAKFRYTAAGRNSNIRNVITTINGTQLEDRQINYFDSHNNSEYIVVPQSLISSGTVNIEIKNSVGTADRLVFGMYEFIYPRQFDFGGQTSFSFEFPAANSSKKLVIKNFNHEGVVPVLFDLTNGLRLEVQPQNDGQFTVVLPASGVARELVFASMSTSRVGSLSAFEQVNFVNYLLPANQGNYLIISNPLIYKDAQGVNQVQEYAAYRGSEIGGSYKVVVADINQLIDQFGWGIKNNPLSIRNFLRFGRKNFPHKDQYCLLIGKGVSANLARNNENTRAIGILNLVPTFGVPSSDVMLASNDNSIVPLTHIGRLNVVNAEEIKEYLDKLKIYDQKQKIKTCFVEEELWKKKFMHVGGANDFLGEQIMFHLNQYKTIAEDTSIGAKVYTLQKSSLTNVQVLAGEVVNDLFTNGFSLMTYFGHSSASTLEFNLDNPENYPYSGRFPFFVVNGCGAGNLFRFDSLRLSGSYTLSEKYVISTPLKGSIGFLASTHLGVVSMLNLYTTELYQQMAQTAYGQPIGNAISNVVDTLIRKFTLNDFLVRMHAEEITLHGDPAVILYHFDKPDYAIEPENLKISPDFISVGEERYTASIKIFNIGRAVDDSLFVRVVKIRPDGFTDTLYNQNISAIDYSDSIELKLELNPLTDKGLNKLVVMLDPNNTINEFCENNNAVTKDYFIYEDEIRPVYPYNYCIVSRKNFKFYASTANPMSQMRNYFFEIDTTANFNSPILQKEQISSAGGLLEFNSVGKNILENKVYYWRVGLQAGLNMPIQWTMHSFIFRPDLSDGYNQSHFYQLNLNKLNHLDLDSVSRIFGFKEVNRKLKIRTGLHPYFDFDANDVYLDVERVDFWRCLLWNVFSIYVFEPKSLTPWVNLPLGDVGTHLSEKVCGRAGVIRRRFEYSMENSRSRNNARLMIDSIIPNGAYVLILNQGTGVGSFYPANTGFIQQWMSDTALYGKDKSIYHTLKSRGLTQIDSFTRNLPFAFLFKKGDPGFVRQFIGEKENDFIDVVVDLPAQLQNGSMESPWLGPNKSWDSFIWDGEYKGGRSAQDSTFFDIIGKKNDGSEQLLATVLNAKDTSISFIDASLYPYLKLKMRTQDSTMLTPFQLNYWRLTGTPIPEGALMPNVSLIAKDTAEIGEQYAFAIAFKNISATAFDSLKLKFIITDKNYKQKEILFPRQKPLVSGDTILIKYTINIDDLEGLNRIYLMVNPDNDQPEQYLYNNFIYKDFFVRRDTEKPWLDVTFDGVHILNRDIVSAKPHILIQLKDENKFRPVLNQDSVIVEIRFPDQSVRKYRLGSDSARITASDLSTGKNELVIDVLPYCDQDGEYELIVYPQNQTAVNKLFGTYRINFQVINKPMISHLFNYPNPFTSSTAFVFTLTGSEIPQNLRIQVMTVTGKVVREITRQELGTIRIGKNITEYKWDGTDQYGNQLGNGVYLYRVITNLNGKQLDHYKVPNAETDQYFNNGYGKMYLMR